MDDKIASQLVKSNYNIQENIQIKNETTLIGENSQPISNGNIFFSYLILKENSGESVINSLKVYMDQGKTLILQASNSKIPLFYSSSFNFFNLSLHPNEIEIDSNYYLIITLNFKNCEEGEIFLSSVKMYS